MSAAPEIAVPDRFAGLIGQAVAAIDTPALVIDLDAMDRNLHRMADFCLARGMRLRPHAKMHKCAELALLQMAHGAVGVCVQKIGEALALASKGVGDIYVSNEVVDPRKLARLATAVRTGGTRFAIAVDSLVGIQHLAQALAHAGVSAPGAIDVFVEIDVGHGRCGMAPGVPAGELARTVVAQPVLRFAGLQAYHGAAQHYRSADERRATVAAATQAVRATCDAIEAMGIAVPLVTGAGTGTFIHEAASGVWGELQAGSYLFMDADYAANQADPAAPAFEHALFVKSQVMSRPQGRAVVDAGHKSHAIDSGLPRVWLPQGLDFANGGDEHGVLRGAHLPELGETVWLVPGHCDPTVNLHDVMVGVRGGLIAGRVERLLPVDARGALG
ncbi:MAG: DSD1 family PLP-dependent enzyme [Hydrogenophaga sp.]|uniref:DSD1 family PLP-dependent enzyme n=1 Tax=Hydrogenophaga sp. TaxID=1904254 RepID=UPI001D805BE6|nr:DSD1 family PLP-dependent enzyme [Hydrogenophaga sp.]MBX3611158.1 DSD1 family PLP-dependent enzyme [Hydrogenophaga sp.]